MKVFLSWSGDKSHAVAETMQDWLSCVLQPLRLWISSKGIEMGSLWYTEISDRLSETGVGIVFLTMENKDSPWIMFESGALAKGLPESRVCTFLIDLDPIDINNPLANFNHTKKNKDSIKGLVKTLNYHLGDLSLPEKILDRVFEKNWQELDERLNKINENFPASGKSKSEKSGEKDFEMSNELLKELVMSTRTLRKGMHSLESRIEQSSSSNNSDEEKMFHIRSLVKDIKQENDFLKSQLHKKELELKNINHRLAHGVGLTSFQRGDDEMDSENT